MAFSKRSINAKYMGDEPDPIDWDSLPPEAFSIDDHVVVISCASLCICVKVVELE